LVEFFDEEEIQGRSAFGARPDHSGLPQDAKVMGEGGLGHVESETAARDALLVRELAHDLQANGVSEGMEDLREVARARGALGIWLDHGYRN